MAKSAERPRTFGDTAKHVAKRVFRHENAVLIGILIIVIALLAAVTGGKTVTPGNVRNILLQSSSRGVASVGQAFVILTAGIDISVGGLSLLALMIGASLLSTEPAQNIIGIPLAVAAGAPIILLIGLGIGAINGVSVSRIGMPALIVTLAMWQITTGVAYQICHGHTISNIPPPVGYVGQGFVGPVPVPIIIFISVAVVAYYVLNYTTFGRSVYAVGGSPVSAYLSGIRVPRILFSVYAISGFLAGLAGLITLGRTMSGSMLATSRLEIDTIAAVTVGGVSLMGGRGNMIGVVLGVLIISVINNGMIMMALAPSYQDIIRGAVIFAAVAADVLRRRRG